VATNFPASLDSLTNPTSSDSLNSPSHSAQHANSNDAIEALQAKVGADSSAVTTSHDYKIADHASRLTTLESAAGPGAVLIASQRGSSVASISFDNCFSSTYDNYRILVHDSLGSNSTPVSFNYRERISSSDVTTATYARAGYFRSSSSATNLYQINLSYAPLGGIADLSSSCVLDVMNPYTSNRSTIYSFTVSWGTVAAEAAWNQFLCPSTSSVDGFTLYPASGTFSGTVSVYGYVKS